MDRSPADDAAGRQLSLFEADDVEDVRFGGQHRLAHLAGRIVEYRFRRSRRRTIGISVDAHGLCVAAPLAAPWRDIDGFLREKARWITARLDEWAGVPAPRTLHGVSGETLPLLGRTVCLAICAGPRGVREEGDRLFLTVADPVRRSQALGLLMEWLKIRALEMLAPRAAQYAALLGRAAPVVRLTGARAQWGVCTEDGVIRLNWRLVHLEPSLADYVVAHETAHLVELNHSKRFWKLLGTLYPEWRDARERLELADRSLPRFRGIR